MRTPSSLPLRVAGLLLAAQLTACPVGRSVLAPREDVADATTDVADETPLPDAAPEATAEVGADAAEVGLDAVEVGADAVEVGVDATEVGVDAIEVGVDAVEVGVDAPECPMGQARCGGACVNTQTDAMNCGACGMTCPGATNGMGACTAGVCTLACNTGFTACGGACLNTQTDVMNCGRCGMTCPGAANGMAACVAGACAVTCNTGFTACGGACVNTQADAMNCGRCGMACPAGQSCMAGACVMECRAPNTMCGSACVNPQTDANHCGMCNNRCAAPTGGTTSCVAGTCRPACPGSQIVCGNACVDTQTSAAHCGRCNNACMAPANATAACAGGACGIGMCNAGFGNCDMNAANGCETNTNTAVAHCGRCGNLCPTPPNATAACAGGACGVGMCNAGFGNCDMNAANGCEANFASNRAHCGRCGMACAAGQDCVAGACACPLGQTLCGGACVNLTSDTLHCGMCNRACPTGQVCRTGTCQMSCASGSTLCGTQCVTLGDNVNHCGACNNRCAADQTCASGRCVTVMTIDPIGCADGTREGFTDRTMFPNIAACAGAWRQQGIFPAIPASTLPACATLGNSSTMAPADGAGCSAANLCARGWRICNGGDVLPRTRNMGCAAGNYPTPGFYAAAVSGTGCAICALRTGTVTGAACTSNSCQANCRESGDLNNDFFGCGTLGGGVPGACDGLNRFSDNNCASLGAPWSCGGDTMESRTVTKTGAAGGGVLCCRD